MNSIDGRISKLEHQLGIARNAPRYLLILTDRDLESNAMPRFSQLGKRD
jgi:hypothetical protein